MAKILDLTINDHSSHLSARVTLVGHPGADAPTTVLMEQFTTRGQRVQPGQSATGDRKPTMPVTTDAGTQVQFQIQNEGQQPLYWLALGVDTSTQAFTCYPVQPEHPQESASPDASTPVPNAVSATPASAEIAPNSILTIASVQNPFVVHGPAGWYTTYIVVSRQPLLGLMNRLQAAFGKVGDRAISDIQSLKEPVAVAETLLQDLHTLSRETAATAGLEDESDWVLDVNQWTTFRFRMQVV